MLKLLVILVVIISNTTDFECLQGPCLDPLMTCVPILLKPVNRFAEQIK